MKINNVDKVALAVLILVIALVWWKPQEESPNIGSVEPIVDTALAPVTPEPLLSLDNVEFERPEQLEFSQNPDGTMSINFASQIRDELQFRGKIERFSSYQSFLSDGYPTRRDHNYSGNGVELMSYGDAGGLTKQYLVTLADSSLLVFSRTTYDDPDSWGVRETEKSEQYKLLDRLFDEMSRSVRVVN